MKPRITAFVCLIAVATLPVSALGASYPDGEGMDFSWTNASDLNGFFGMPLATLDQNFIFFPTSRFDAQASPSQPVETVSDSLQMQLDSKNGLMFESISFVVRGDYDINAGQVGDASVQSSGDVTLATLAGLPLDPGADTGSYFFFEDTPTAGSQNWQETIIITVPLTKAVTSLQLTANQENVAVASEGSASILTNFEIIGIELGLIIPEPSTLALLALGGCAVLRRRR